MAREGLSFTEMNAMSASGEFSFLTEDVIVLMADIVDCPLVEIPLIELFNNKTFTLVENYLQVLHSYVIQLLEDIVWMDMPSFAHLMSAGYDINHPILATGECLAMTKLALQRLILQTIHCHEHDRHCEVPLLISFLLHGNDCPRHHRRSDLSHDVTRRVIPTSKNKQRCPPIVQVRNSASDSAQRSSRDVGSKLLITVATDKPKTGVSRTQLQHLEGNTTQHADNSRPGQTVVVLQDRRLNYPGTAHNYEVAIDVDAHLVVQQGVSTFSDGNMDGNATSPDTTVAVIFPADATSLETILLQSFRVTNTTESDLLTVLVDNTVAMHEKNLSAHLDRDGADSRSRLAKDIREALQSPERSGRSAGVTEYFDIIRPCGNQLALATATYLRESAGLVDDVAPFFLPLLDDDPTTRDCPPCLGFEMPAKTALIVAPQLSSCMAVRRDFLLPSTMIPKLVTLLLLGRPPIGEWLGEANECHRHFGVDCNLLAGPCPLPFSVLARYKPFDRGRVPLFPPLSDSSTNCFP